MAAIAGVPRLRAPAAGLPARILPDRGRDVLAFLAERGRRAKRAPRQP